jgi:hypothetical protein
MNLKALLFAASLYSFIHFHFLMFYSFYLLFVVFKRRITNIRIFTNNLQLRYVFIGLRKLPIIRQVCFLALLSGFILISSLMVILNLIWGKRCTFNFFYCLSALKKLPSSIILLRKFLFDAPLVSKHKVSIYMESIGILNILTLF